MTGYTVHTGSTEKFSEGWDQIFKKGAKKSPSRAKKPAAKKSSAGTKGRKRSKSR